MASVIRGDDNFDSLAKTINGESIFGVGGNLTLSGAADLGLYHAGGTGYGFLSYSTSGNVGPDHTTTTNRLWIIGGWRGNGGTSDGNSGNGDIWLNGSGGRIITCLGGNTPNTINQFTWNKRNFLTTSGTNHYRSSNSITRPTAAGIIYMDAGCRMGTDRQYYFYDTTFLEVPSSDSTLRDFALAFFEGAS